MGVDLGFRKQQLTGVLVDRAVIKNQPDLGRVGSDTVEISVIECAAKMIEFGATPFNVSV